MRAWARTFPHIWQYSTVFYLQRLFYIYLPFFADNLHPLHARTLSDITIPAHIR